MAGVAKDWWPPKWPGVIYQLLQCCSHLPTAVLMLTLRSFYWHRRQQCWLKTYLPSQIFLWVVKKTGKIRTKAHNEENLVTKTKNRRKTSTNNINGQKMSYSTMTVQIWLPKWCNVATGWCPVGWKVKGTGATVTNSGPPPVTVLYLRVCAWRGAS